MAEKATGNPMPYCDLDCSQCFGYAKTISEEAKGFRRTMRAGRMK